MPVHTQGTDTAGEPAVRKAEAPSGPRGTTRAATASRGRRAAAAPYLLLLPALLATLILLGWPLVKNGMLSFQNLNARQLIQHLTEWNGAENYQEALGSSEFWAVVQRTVYFTAANVVLIMLLGTLIGLLLARLGRRMRLLLLLGLVLAWAMPVIAATTVYQWLFAQRFGVVNWVLDKAGWHSMADYNWLGTQFSTFSVVTLLIVWQSVPFVAINLYAATTTVPKELYEAASLDGANSWTSFTSVTFPFLRPFLYATTFLEVIWVFKAFPQIFAINEGGPDRLTETLPIYAFVEGVGNQHYGMGAAISFLTILVLIVITSYYLRAVIKQEEDEL
ncbi:carbohydrate ABC transporter permease [Streptomyces griseoloalbus]|uniref:N,N'-diacetylchitobiose transport system permease protein n=1 Tax=Streptomyces griseoloalbus TaxID=67303 RepID=A0A7W8F862_9ACTN|nr:sugar ABC transporter permease [Streptomyces albaduncus]MBB5124790.1 N,N'-diacetylchitobiose transport system permease protein [Streptomyces albaduncus]GGV71119.1 sugar ABC transporter permease [Streptomyces griseoloalbus]GGW39438.1 sugar ABC transporter permease [Streptomyces albaduncus]